jgi:hypothetical protein
MLRLCRIASGIRVTGHRPTDWAYFSDYLPDREGTAMNPVRIPAVIAIALATVVCSPALRAAEPAAPAETQAEAQAKAQAASKTETIAQVSVAPARDPDKVVCKTVTPTGTRVASRTCKKQSEWDEFARASRDTLNRAQTQAKMTNMGGGG